MFGVPSYFSRLVRLVEFRDVATGFRVMCLAYMHTHRHRVAVAATQHLLMTLCSAAHCHTILHSHLDGHCRGK